MKYAKNKSIRYLYFLITCILLILLIYNILYLNCTQVMNIIIQYACTSINNSK